MAFICCSSTSPRKPTRRRHIFGIRNNKKTTNPYADNGLDKFEALLADLDQKRQKILAQKGSEDVSMVKFIYRNSNEIEPIVIKLQDQRKHHNTSSLSTPEVDHLKNFSIIKTNNIGGNEAEEDSTKPVAHDHIKNIKSGQCKRKIGEWRKSCYFPLFVMLILVLLTLFGRSLAILCASICWYLVPVVNGKLYKSRKSNKNTKGLFGRDLMGPFRA